MVSLTVLHEEDIVWKGFAMKPHIGETLLIDGTMWVVEAVISGFSEVTPGTVVVVLVEPGPCNLAYLFN